MKPLAEVHTESEIEYTNCFWGEIVNGTKAQLQSLGLGVNKPFPGEPNGPKRSMRLIDPRGLSAKILKWYDGKYAACIKYHGRSIPETEQWVEYASGVRLLRSCWDDKYVGSARALETVGIVMAAQVPGQPGMRKLKVTIYADGSIPKSPTGTNNRLAHAAGAKIIERHSKDTFCVSVRISSDESARRKPYFDSLGVFRTNEMRRLMALPRPPRLTVRSGVYAQHRLAYAADADFQAFRTKLLDPVPLEENDGAAS